MKKGIVTGCCAALLVVITSPAVRALDNEPGHCVGNCGGSPPPVSNGGWQGGSGNTYSAPQESHAQKTERLRSVGKARWENRAYGRRQEWSGQLDRARSLTREGEELVKKNAAAGTVVTDKNTSMFGIKSGAGDQILKKAPEGRGRVLKTEWERLGCASRISLSAMRAVGDQNNLDLEEARFLAQEGLNALQGETREAECPPLQAPSPSPENLQWRQGVVKEILEDIPKQADAMDRAQMALPTLEKERDRKKESADAAAKELEELKGKALERQRTEQKGKGPQAKSKQKGPDAGGRKPGGPVNDAELAAIVKEQKEKQQAMEAALAALREIQRAINEENARKSDAFNNVSTGDAMKAALSGIKEAP